MEKTVLLDVIEAPDPYLKTVSTPVGAVDADLRRLMTNMAETMYEAPGIGLAGIQVGVSKRLLVMDTNWDEATPRNPKFIINPEIIWASDERSVYNEGCLSVPEHYAEVERPAEVTLRYLDYNGEQVEETLSGLDATCVQHEIDHLDGVLFIDHLSKLKRSMIIKRLRKTQRDSVVL